MTAAQILTELFQQSPLPNRLKSQKQRFEAGRLGQAAQIRIIEEYTPWRCTIIFTRNDQPPTSAKAV